MDQQLEEEKKKMIKGSEDVAAYKKYYDLRFDHNIF